MQEAYLVPTECARLLPGPNPALPFLPKSISSRLHTKETRTRQDTASIGHPVPGLCVPVGGWSLERPLLAVKASASACLGRLFSSFPTPRPGSHVEWSVLPVECRTRGLPGFPQPPFKQSINSTSLRDRRAASLAREDKEWTRTRTTTLPPLKSERD